MGVNRGRRLRLMVPILICPGEAWPLCSFWSVAIGSVCLKILEHPMRWKLLAALLLSLEVMSPAIARQGQISAPQQRTASYRQDFMSAKTTRNPESEIRRAETSRRHERLLSRDPEEIIPDICTGC